MTHSAADERDEQSPNSKVPSLGASERARILSKVLTSPVMKRPIIRRPKAVGIAAALALAVRQRPRHLVLLPMVVEIWPLNTA